MTKTEANAARRELEHALAALDDGSGHETWGPGVVGQKLWDRSWEQPWVAMAFDTASQVVYKFRCQTGGVHMSERPGFIDDVRKLAPVMLELLLARA